MGVLTVFLDKVTNLKDADTIGKSDPYVKFELEQDNVFKDKNFGNRTSTKKKNDLNPVYGETFTFCDVPSLDNLKLHIKVMDDDLLKDDKIGSTSIKLEKIKELESGTPYEGQWVVDNNLFKKDGTIYLTLTWTA